MAGTAITGAVANAGETMSTLSLRDHLPAFGLSASSHCGQSILIIARRVCLALFDASTISMLLTDREFIVAE